MSFHPDRRQHRRYPLRLAIRLHRGNEGLDAAILNASANGCLLLSSAPLEPGEVLEASIPELLIPRTKLHIMRCQATPSGYMVAACFDAAMLDESSLAMLVEEQHGASRPPRWLN
ncbi:MAG: PilZ domain-containing protein [Myxococcaceae bacterium]|nr:PilZ domain-containing protein [Myxococcaceae bacterium]